MKLNADGSMSMDSLSVDAIAEKTPAAGVTIDGLLIKDSAHAQITGADDLHTEYQKESEKGAANGYASLAAAAKVPTVELGGAGADATKFLRGDQSWAVPSGGGAAPEWLDLHRAGATGNQTGIVTGTDIVMDASDGNGIAYDAATGVATLKAGKTYRLWATFALFSIQSGDTVAVEWVKASDDTPLREGHETRIRPANANSNGSNAPTIEVIYKPTADTGVKLRCTEYTHNTDTVTMYWERSMATVIEIR